jgi:metal-responsive CopG/Arc/MetJ family transcriptional regulator
MEQVVSVRMPKSLLEELRKISEKEHYMDVSDAIRSVLRQKYIMTRRPEAAKMHEIKKKLSGITDKKKLDALKEAVKLLEEINES